MKTTKMLTILVLALAPVASAAQSLTVNGEALDTITLKTGRACMVEVLSDNSNPYSAYVGFDDQLVLGSFAHIETRAEAGDLASVSAYSVPDFEGYFVTAAGSSPPPSAGVHFVFAYNPSALGDTTLKLYDSTMTNVLDSVQITVLSSAMGTTITYQGRLIDNNDVADGLYDLRFELYDAPWDGNQIGSTVEANDLDIVDGYFTMELDFGPVYDGNAMWLGIEVRAGEVNDPNGYTMLSPRQRVMPTPYALGVRGIYVDDRENVGMGTTSPKGKLHVDGGKAADDTNASNIIIKAQDGGDTVRGFIGRSGGDIILLPGEGGESPPLTLPGPPGKVGIGTLTPEQDLTVQAGRPRVALVENGGDAGVLEFHEDTNQLRLQYWTDYGNTWNKDMMVLEGDTGKVGIGTTAPRASLEVTNNGSSHAIWASTNDIPVYALRTGTSGTWPAVSGDCNSQSNDASGVRGRILSTSPGSLSAGIYGYNYGTGSNGVGVRGYHDGTGAGVYGQCDSGDGRGVHGHSNNGKGVYGESNNGYGVYGYSNNYIAVYGHSNSIAGVFVGNVQVTGNLTKGGGSFKIDHPLDPDNKYLQHSFVESPDMMNVYNGNVTLDKNGEAMVKLPEYFEALNQDFRYQLTSIGGFAPIYVSEEISENQFKISGGKRGMKVSWQVTGIRHDAYAKANRIVVEEDKAVETRGYYLHPEVYGFGKEKSIDTVRNAQISETRKVAINTD